MESEHNLESEQDTIDPTLEKKAYATTRASLGFLSSQLPHQLPARRVDVH